jgi:hypothetical protein
VEEKSGLLEQFPQLVDRHRKGEELPVHKDLNPITQQEAEKNDGE